MNGYLFAASVTRTQVRPTDVGRGQTAELLNEWAETPSYIVCANDAGAAQVLFESGICAQPEGEPPLQTRVHKIVAAQVIGELLTETATLPLDWTETAKQAIIDLQSITPDEMGQGYWLNLNEVLPAGADIQALRRNLPGEIASELNWSADKLFFFVIRVLSSTPPLDVELPEATAGIQLDESGNELSEEPVEIPALADLDAAAVIRARNSAVAAWRWRNYAANTPLAGQQIHLDAWCGVSGIDMSEAQSEE